MQALDHSQNDARLLMLIATCDIMYWSRFSHEINRTGLFYEHSLNLLVRCATISTV